MEHAAPSPATRPGLVPTADSALFWTEAAKGRLVLRQCTVCGRIAGPLSPRCIDCLADTFTGIECSGRALLAGRTVLHMPAFPGQSLPAVLAECALAEDPRIVLIAVDPDNLSKHLSPGATIGVRFSDIGGRSLLRLVERGDAG